ncbi:MAG: hypothetical protein KJ850_01055 [Gammaproteobacteria bacterium]|nr:hypothetical protein [Gammaproteobacteria bacterium]MBU1623611.1 hypothetical protein [Gammaproteobacteria bacterium]
MLKKTFISAALLLAFAPCTFAAEHANNCRLKHGSMVMLAAEACAMEGGVAVSKSAAPVIPVASLQLSAKPELAAAQRGVAELLMKPVVDKNLNKRMPEVIERTVKFDGCRLLVDEDMFVDHGNVFSDRKHFKISSTVDMGKVSRAAFGELGKVTSYGGGLEAYANYFEEHKAGDGNNLSVSMQLQTESGPIKYRVSASGIYWDAPNEDLWMVDEFGYPKDVINRGAARDKVRLMFLMNTAEDSAALNKALGEVHALCQR